MQKLDGVKADARWWLPPQNRNRQLCLFLRFYCWFVSLSIDQHRFCKQYRSRSNTMIPITDHITYWRLKYIEDDWILYVYFLGYSGFVLISQDTHTCVHVYCRHAAHVCIYAIIYREINAHTYIFMYLYIHVYIHSHAVFQSHFNISTLVGVEEFSLHNQLEQDQI